MKNSGRITLLVIVALLVCGTSALKVVADLEKSCRSLNSSCRSDIETQKQLLVFNTTQRFNDSIVEFRNSSFPTVPANLFKVFNGVTWLMLKDCNIRNIYDWNFVHSDRLTELDLTNNSIEVLRDDVFSKTKQLTFLLLQFNRISEIQEDSLRNLTSLQNLYLFGNNIKTLPSGLFKYSKNLHVLDLRYNHLEVVQSELFDNTPLLKTLFLGYNKLRTLDNGFLDLLFLYNLPNLITLQLSGNKVERIQDTAFSNNLILHSLYLVNTNISKLEGAMFENLISLKVLDVSDNNLQKFDVGMLSPLLQLKALYLRGNNLTQLDYEALLCGQTLEKIDLTKNNWECGFLQSMVNALREKRVILTLNSHEYLLNKTDVLGIECKASDSQIHTFFPRYSRPNDRPAVNEQDSALVVKLSEIVKKFRGFSADGWDIRSVILISAIGVNLLVGSILLTIYLVRRHRGTYARLDEDKVSVI